jgi:uncharacterized alkaline shock family protein YloU
VADHPESSDEAPGTRIPVPEQRGTLTIADQVIEKIASIAANEIETVVDDRSGWLRFVGGRLPRASATVAGERARVRVDVAVAWPTPLPAMTARVRDHVSERIEALTGTQVVAVDVNVADVVHVETNSRRVQ